ncbi:MAG: hypothetical protein WEC75_06610 [Dehalococcoidia bacterium]
MLAYFQAFNGRSFGDSAATFLSLVLVLAVILVLAAVVFLGTSIGSEVAGADLPACLLVASVTAGLAVPQLVIVLAAVTSCSVGIGMPWPGGDPCSAAR